MKAQKKISKAQPKKVAKAVKAIPKKEVPKKTVIKKEVSPKIKKTETAPQAIQQEPKTKRTSTPLIKKILDDDKKNNPIQGDKDVTPVQAIETPRLPQYINDEQRRHQDWLKNNKPG